MKEQNQDISPLPFARVPVGALKDNMVTQITVTVQMH